MTRHTLIHRVAPRHLTAIALLSLFAACSGEPTGNAVRNLNADIPFVQRPDSGVTCTGLSADEAQQICILGRADGTVIDPLTHATTCTCVAASMR